MQKDPLSPLPPPPELLRFALNVDPQASSPHAPFDDFSTTVYSPESAGLRQVPTFVFIALNSKQSLSSPWKQIWWLLWKQEWRRNGKGGELESLQSPAFTIAPPHCVGSTLNETRRGGVASPYATDCLRGLPHLCGEVKSAHPPSLLPVSSYVFL